MIGTMKSQGQLIRQARLSAGMTQAALAFAAGTRERNIIRWENDQHHARFEHIASIARATGKSVEFFLTDGSDDDEAEAASMAAGGPLTPEEIGLLGDLMGRLIRPKVAA